MIRKIAWHDHLYNRGSDIPILGLAQQFKDVVLGVEEELEGDSTVMILKYGLVIISEGLCMSHSYQEWIINAWMLNVAQEASQEGWHDIQITKVLHELALLSVEMEVSCQLNYLGDVVITVLLISRIDDAIDEWRKVLIGDWELI